MVVLEADLCIVGAGYAGVNALNAAAHHLSPGARVVVIARERDWGGQVSEHIMCCRERLALAIELSTLRNTAV